MYLGHTRNNQNPADKGELCEIFIKKFLEDFLGDIFKIFRGGKIVDSENRESKQIDILIAARNTLKFFGDKGIYPIESIYGVFSITSSLGYKKMLSCLDELASIPMSHPKFMIIDSTLSHDLVVQKWRECLPYKCVFGFNGDINQKWADELNEYVASGRYSKNTLPDAIVVNKTGLITKAGEFAKSEYLKKGILVKDFHYTDLNLLKNNGVVFHHILNDLFVLNTWQYKITPQYHAYLNKDMGVSA